MKIRVVSSKEEIETLKSSDEVIHLAFRPSNKDIFNLVMACPNIKAIHIPSSYKKTLSESVQMYLAMQNIALLEGDVWGHRKDINEYSEVSQHVLDRIDELKAEKMSTDDIVALVTKETKLSEDFIRFIVEA
ncbi:DUF1699 family protein [Methanolapillus ohkumae]|uniref:DUF1699 family protein n=1 Tax=Methanolapillus ohkumae TaxID=3028298 RepID=A0AA96ZVW9_9EURY|nr:hypothetical protein MsAm2_11450 [Methanosarcinaceae archaeon Am2]